MGGICSLRGKVESFLEGKFSSDFYVKRVALVGNLYSYCFI